MRFPYFFSNQAINYHSPSYLFYHRKVTFDSKWEKEPGDLRILTLSCPPLLEMSRQSR